jgi:hypothetical protein
MPVKKFKDLSSFGLTSNKGEKLTVTVLNANTNSNLDIIEAAIDISTGASNPCKKFRVKFR